MGNAPQKPAAGEARLEVKERASERKAHERRNMDAAKRRDAHIGCRNPGCAYRAKKLRIECAHRKDRHRGQGGNPAGDRTTTDLLMSLCVRCHWIYDKTGDLDWTPQTDKGADGCVDWWRRAESGRMEIFASEKSIGVSVSRS